MRRRRGGGSLGTGKEESIKTRRGKEEKEEREKKKRSVVAAIKNLFDDRRCRDRGEKSGGGVEKRGRGRRIGGDTRAERGRGGRGRERIGGEIIMLRRGVCVCVTIYTIRNDVYDSPMCREFTCRRGRVVARVQQRVAQPRYGVHA